MHRQRGERQRRGWSSLYPVPQPARPSEPRDPALGSRGASSRHGPLSRSVFALLVKLATRTKHNTVGRTPRADAVAMGAGGLIEKINAKKPKNITFRGKDWEFGIADAN